MDNLKIEENKNLLPFFSIRTSIIAEKFILAKTREDLIFAKKFALKEKLPFFILGGGTNIVAISEKFSGLVVKNEYKKFIILENNKKMTKILVSSGYPVSLLALQVAKLGLSGFEYFTGLPGTVGGAIYMNSKWTKPKSYFGDNLIYAYLLDNKGKVKKVNKEYFDFAYDYSILQKTKELILEAVFSLKKDSKEIINKKMRETLNYRKITQPKGVFTAGCFFRNIDKEEQKKLKLENSSAGYLIDKAGLKGLRIGGFYISDIHANFIINDGSGIKSDLKKILKIIKEKVEAKFGIKLKEEVIII